MTERKELLRGKIAVGKLVAEKHAHDCGDGKRIQDQRQPRAPDEEFQNHHEEKFEADCFVHRRDLTARVGKTARAGKQRASFVRSQWSVVSGQWSAVSGQRSVVSD